MTSRWRRRTRDWSNGSVDQKSLLMVARAVGVQMAQSNATCIQANVSHSAVHGYMVGNGYFGGRVRYMVLLRMDVSSYYRIDPSQRWVWLVMVSFCRDSGFMPVGRCGGQGVGEIPFRSRMTKATACPRSCIVC